MWSFIYNGHERERGHFWAHCNGARYSGLLMKRKKELLDARREAISAVLYRVLLMRIKEAGEKQVALCSLSLAISLERGEIYSAGDGP